jgi:hypothetical protein
MKSLNFEELYATPVKPDEILSIVNDMARLHEEGEKPDFYTAMFMLTDRYRGEQDAVDKVFIISERLRCLAELSKKKDDRMGGWTMEAVEPDCMITNTAVFAATALCPLTKGENDRCYFDADQFFDIVLRESDSEGKA